MPFTLAHSAAALPFRRFHLVTSALVIGTFAPDFEYFLRFAPDRRFGHTIVGTFELTLPVALLVLWIFHAFVKRPAAGLMPDGVQRRLSPYLGHFRFRGPWRFLLIVMSVLLGIATHLLWDSFTHPGTWAYRRWGLFRQMVHTPLLGTVPYYKLFQYGSSVVGTAAVVVWLALWYRTSARSAELPRGSVRPTRRVVIVAGILAIALIGGLVRAILGADPWTVHFSRSRFAGQLVSTFIALVWWELVAYGLVCSRERSV